MILDSHRIRFTLLVFVALAALTSGVAGDVIYRRDGRKVVGKITQEEESRVQIEIRQGELSARIWIPRKEIFRIDKGLTPDEEFQDRLGKLDPLDLEGHAALLEWAKQEKVRAGIELLERRIPKIQARRLKIDHPRTWCRHCDASGVEICGECEGEGKVLDPCDRCDGRGDEPCRTCANRETGQLRCRRCGGEGKYERFDPRLGRKKLVECDDCRGSGVHDCPNCKGKQVVECPKCEGKKGLAITCKKCQGKPKKTCTVCSGTRVQPTPVTDEQLAAEKKAAEEAAKKEAAAKEAEAAEKKDDKKENPEKEAAEKKPGGTG